MQLFNDSPLGVGWGTVSYLSDQDITFKGKAVDFPGFTNLYLEILTSAGIVGLTLFMLSIFRYCKAVYFSSRSNDCLLSISLFSLLFHYFFISNYWYPYIWLVFAMIDSHKLREKS